MNSKLIAKANRILIVTSPRTGGTCLLYSLSYPVTDRTLYDEPLGDLPEVADGKVTWRKKTRNDLWRVLPRVAVKTHLSHHIQIHSEGPHPPPWPYTDEAIEKGKEHLKTCMKMFDYTIFLKRRNKFLQTMSFCRAREWTRSFKGFSWNYLNKPGTPELHMPDFTKHPVKIDPFFVQEQSEKFLTYDKIIDEMSHLGDEVLHYEDIKFQDNYNLTVKFPSYEKTILNYQECVDAWNCMHDIH